MCLMPTPLSDIAHEIAADIFGARQRELTPILGLGSVNAVFLLRTPNERLIIRLNPDPDVGRFRKESWCIAQASRLGIPSPAVVRVGETRGAAYMVQTFVEGQNGKRLTGDVGPYWETLGLYSRMIHSVAVTGFGEDLADEQAGRFKDSWPRFLGYNIDSLTPGDPLLALGVLTPGTSVNLRARFKDLFETPFDFGLNHGDIALRNTLVNAQGDVVLLDWGCAEAHVVPHFELAELARSGMSVSSRDYQAFLRGYGISDADHRRIAPDIQALTALRNVDKLRWAIDRKPELILEFAERAHRSLAAL